MRFLLRLLGVLVLLISAVVFVACVAGIVAIWMYHQDAVRTLEKVSSRLETGLDRVVAANHDVEQALKTARADVNHVNVDTAGLSTEDADKNRFTTFLLRKLVQQEAGPRINEVGGRLAMFSDASVAVASLLQSFQELPFSQAKRIDTEGLQNAATQATQLSASLQKLQVTLGEAETPATQKDVVAAANEVDRVLQKCETTVADWQIDLDAAHAELLRLKAKTLWWLMLASIGGTIVCAWVGLSQLSLFAHAWRWCWGA